MIKVAKVAVFAVFVPLKKVAFDRLVVVSRECRFWGNRLLVVELEK